MAVTTVIKTIGSGGDYTTLQSWEDAKPTDLTDSRSNTTQAGSTSSTIVLDASASGTTGAYIGHAVSCDARPSEKRLITAYNTSTKVATIGVLNGSSATWANTPGTEAYTIDQCIWQGQIKSATDHFVGAAFANMLTISGSTTSSTCYAELTTAAGAGFNQNANVQTNALKYNTANGCSIDANPAYNQAILTSETQTRFSNLQVTSVSSGGNGSTYQLFGVLVNSCIFQITNGSEGANVRGTFNNCLFVNTSGVVIHINDFAVGGTDSFNGCTFIGNGGGAAFATGYCTVTLKNCAVFNCTAVNAAFGGGVTFTSTTCGSDLASPGTGFTGSMSFSGSTFVSTTDLRLVTGSPLLNIGTTDSTDTPTDIAGTTRPQGSAYDIGCWELVVGGGTVNSGFFFAVSR